MEFTGVPVSLTFKVAYRTDGLHFTLRLNLLKDLFSVIFVLSCSYTCQALKLFLR